MTSKFDRKSAKALLSIPEAEKRIRQELPALLDRMFDLAKGVCVLQEYLDKDSGEVVQRVYRLPPDRAALQFLIENAVGKVPNRVEMSGELTEKLTVIPWMPKAASLAELVMEEVDVIDEEV